MNRQTRLFVILIIFVGVIAGMMDCAKRSMRKKEPTEPAPREHPRYPSGNEASP